MALASPYQSAPKLARHGVVRGVSLRYGGSSERPPPHRPEPPHRGPRRRFDGPRRSTPACRSRLAERARLRCRRAAVRRLQVGGGLATTACRRGRRLRPRAPPPRARGGDPKRRTPGTHTGRRHNFDGPARPPWHRRLADRAAAVPSRSSRRGRFTGFAGPAGVSRTARTRRGLAGPPRE